MPNTEPIHIGQRITAAVNYVQAGDDVRAHCLWTLRGILTNMAPEDLSTSALASIIAILIPEHSRFLVRRNPRLGPAPLRLIAGPTRDDGCVG